MRARVASEEIPHTRFPVAGAALAGGFLLGFWLTQTFRWAPYFWQWLAYTNALVVAVLIYLLWPASPREDAPRPSILTRPLVWVQVRPISRTGWRDSSSTERNKKGELRASRMTGWSSNGKGFERTVPFSI